MTERIPEHRVKHGTENAYRRHIRWSETPCEKCKKGHRLYTKERRAKLRRQKGVLQQILSAGEGRLKLTDAETREILETIRKELGL